MRASAHEQGLVSWFLLMIISVVLVAWVHPPRPPFERNPKSTVAASTAAG